MAAEPYRHTVHIAAEPAQVFEYFVRPEAMLRWMGDYAVLEAVPGGVFHVDINGVPVRGRYAEVDPPRRLVITWGHAGSSVLPPGSSTVEVTFEAVPGGTKLTVEHRDLPSEEVPQHAMGWPHFLTRLRSAAAGVDPGPDPFAGR